MIDPYVCIGTPYRPCLLIIVVYGIFLNEISMLYWVRNKKGQIAAEVSEIGLSVHDQKLSWQLQKLKEEGAPPFNAGDASEGRSWNLATLLPFLEESDYTVERQDT